MSTLTSTLSVTTTKPRWVLLSGALHQVSEFAHLPPRERPQTLCPLCEEVVILKLGTQRAHHFAHTQDCDCALNRPETALHFNTKIHFYRELQKATLASPVELYMQQRCKKPSCGASQKWVWARDWDAVEVECRMDSMRPDIALLRKGKVVAALEILVTHAVDERKAILLQAMDIPWAEIAADESLCEGESTWTIADPLPATQHHPQVPAWICPDCEQKAIERRQRLEAETKRLQYERLNHTVLYADRIVDLFHPTGERYRETFEVVKVVEDGMEVRTELRSRGRSVLHSVEGELTQETLDHFVALAKARVEAMRKNGTIVDQVLSWREHRPEKRLAPADPTNFPFRYYWRSGAWVRNEVSSTPTGSLRDGSFPCIWCGRVTDNWYYRDSQGRCHCNDCMRKQKS